MTPIKQLIYKERGILGSVPVSKEYDALLNLYIDYDTKMCQLLEPTPDLLSQYIATTEACEDAHAAQAADHFAEGLRFGILLGIEIAKAPEE